MRRLALALLLAPALAWAQQGENLCDAGQCAAGRVEHCCDELIVATGASEPFLAQGCYVGNDQDGRKIPTGIEQPGLLLLQGVTGAGKIGQWWIPEMGQGVNCIRESTGTPNSCANECGLTNRIQAVTALNGEGYFEIGTDTSVNETGQTYCWWQYGLNANHTTFTYTGNGVSPRDLTLDFEPSVAFVQLYNPDSFSGCFVTTRTDDMAANESAYWNNSVTSDFLTNAIRDFNASPPGMEVGNAGNVNAVTYYGWAFKEAAGYGCLVSWTGNGDSGGGCADAGDVQTIPTGCGAPTHVFTMGCTEDLCDGSTCADHSGTSPIHRGLNTGPDAGAPGNVLGEFDSPTGGSGFLPDVLGNLTATTFDVAGTNGVGVTVLNDTGATYFGWVTTAPAPPALGSTALTDWCDQSAVACYEFENGADLGEMNKGNGTVACGAASCDLSNNNGVTQDTTNKVIGTGSAQYVGASSQNLACDLTSACQELNFTGGSQDLSWGCFVRTNNDTGNQRVLVKANSDYGLFRNATTDAAGCQIVLTGGTSKFSDGPAAGWPADNSWHSVICRHDSTADAMAMLFDGATPGTTATSVTDIRDSSGTNPEFRLGRDGASNFYTGHTDDCWVIADLISEAAACRIASCGLTGGACSCWAGDPTIYLDYGFNTTLGGGCDLTAIACNATTP